MGEIFISYSTKDTNIADNVNESLMGAGFKTWYAPNDIPPGGDYASRITEALDKVSFVLVIVSQHSSLSEHVKREVTLASENNKTIIPFRIDSFPLSEWMRYYISTLNWIEANENDIEESITKLIEKFKSIDSLLQYETSQVKSHYGQSIQEIRGANGRSKTKSYIYNIKDKELARIQAIHVPFSRFQTAENLLNTKRIIFLQSEKHTGKFTSGMALLQNTKAERYYQIFPNISLEELTTLSFEKNAGYIIDNISPDTFNSMNGFSLKKLSENLHSANSFLLITSNDETKMDQGSEHFIKHEPPGNLPKMIQNHINLLPITVSESDQLSQVISDMNLWSLLTNDFLPRDSDELVDKLYSIVNGNLSTTDFLSSLTTNVNERIQSWFEHPRTIDQYALILALAVFNESPYTFVVERTNEIMQLLLSEAQSEETASQETPFGKSILQQLKGIRAETYTGLINTNTGKMQDQFVRFQTKEDATAVLLYFWSNFPQLKDAIVEWIEILAAGSHKYTNEKLITALVNLAKVDPLSINNKIIQAWANHKEEYYRVLSINLLLEMSEYKENLVYIDKLVNYWASLRNNPRLQWTAAVAYGTPIGIYLFPNSFVNLGAIFRFNGPQLTDVVYKSMKYLFDYGNQDASYLLSVPYMFHTWLEDDKTNPLQKQQILQLFYSLLSNINREALNWLLKDQEIQKELLPRWISVGLHNWKSRKIATQVINKFFILANEIPSLHQPLLIFTFSLLVKGSSELKQMIYTILFDIYKQPYNKAAVPIITKIVEIERK